MIGGKNKLKMRSQRSEIAIRDDRHWRQSKWVHEINEIFSTRSKTNKSELIKRNNKRIKASLERGLAFDSTISWWPSAIVSTRSCFQPFLSFFSLCWTCMKSAGTETNACQPKVGSPKRVGVGLERIAWKTFYGWLLLDHNWVSGSSGKRNFISSAVVPTKSREIKSKLTGTGANSQKKVAVSLSIRRFCFDYRLPWILHHWSDVKLWLTSVPFMFRIPAPKSWIMKLKINK